MAKVTTNAKRTAPVWSPKNAKPGTLMLFDGKACFRTEGSDYDEYAVIFLDTGEPMSLEDVDGSEFSPLEKGETVTLTQE